VEGDGSSRTALDVAGLGGAGFEKSSGNWPESREGSGCGDKSIERIGMAFTYYKADRHVWFRAISLTLSPASTMAQEEDFVCVSFAEKQA
jgi:hypothetical protein